MKKRPCYILRVLIAFDQFINTLIGGNPDETISSRVGRNAIMGKRWALIAEKFIDFLFGLIGDKDHCRKRIEWDETKYGIKPTDRQ